MAFQLGGGEENEVTEKYTLKNNLNKHNLQIH